MARFGFSLTGTMAHLIDEQGYPYCESPILYRRDTSEGYSICDKCRRRKQSGQGAIQF
jgi:hypothetical protein